MSDYVEVRRDYRDWTPAYDRSVLIGKGEVSESDSEASPVPVTAGDRHGQPDIHLRDYPGANGNEYTARPQTGNALEAISEKTGEEQV